MVFLERLIPSPANSFSEQNQASTQTRYSAEQVFADPAPQYYHKHSNALNIDPN
jgi:hypothetical protein